MQFLYVTRVRTINNGTFNILGCEKDDGSTITKSTLLLDWCEVLAVWWFL